MSVDFIAFRMILIYIMLFVGNLIHRADILIFQKLVPKRSFDEKACANSWLQSWVSKRSKEI